MKCHLFLCVLLLFLFIHPVSGFTSDSPPMILSEHGSGRATAYAETNKIVTYGSKTHAAWLDSEEDTFLVRIRTFDHVMLEWSPVYTVGEAYDNHGGPALTVDADGYLHIVYYPHHHPFRYRKSIRPNDASAWTEEKQFGKKCTYPSMVCDRDGNLFLVCRESVDSSWKLNFYHKLKGQDWEGPVSLFEGDAEKNYKRFQASLALEPDQKSLHLAFMSFEREFGDIGYLIGYMESHDSGKTWQHHTGRVLRLPANPGTIDFVQHGKPGYTDLNVRMGSLAVDDSGLPWVVYSRLEEQPFDAILATPDGMGGWKQSSLLPLIQERYPNRAVQTPGSVMFAEDGTMYLALTTVRVESAYENPFWGAPSDEIVLFVSKDKGKSMTLYQVSQPNKSVPNWLPNLQRKTSPVEVKVPYLMYTQGVRGENNQQIMSNKVIWCDVPELLGME